MLVLHRNSPNPGRIEAFLYAWKVTTNFLEFSADFYFGIGN
jgi:hypothetical protein